MENTYPKIRVRGSFSLIVILKTRTSAQTISQTFIWQTHLINKPDTSNFSQKQRAKYLAGRYKFQPLNR